MLLELLERRYDQASTVFCTQYAQRDWHQRLGAVVHADAIMDRIVHNTIWVETGGHNMREHTVGRDRIACLRSSEFGCAITSTPGECSSDVRPGLCSHHTCLLPDG